MSRAPHTAPRRRAPYPGVTDPDADGLGLGTDTPERKAELDALEDLGDEIATLAAHIHAATHRLLELIAEFDQRRGWELGGYRSCAHWLSFRTGIDLGAAREKVRTARALTELPETSASMARGEPSFSKVRALTRVADADSEGELLELARGCTTAQPLGRRSASSITIVCRMRPPAPRLEASHRSPPAPRLEDRTGRPHRG